MTAADDNQIKIYFHTHGPFAQILPRLPGSEASPSATAARHPRPPAGCRPPLPPERDHNTRIYAAASEKGYQIHRV
jgi:hypothetical protein